MNQVENLEIINEARGYCEKLYSGMDILINNISERNLIDLETYFKNILEGFNWILEIAVFASDIVGEKLDLIDIEEKINLYITGYNNLDLLYVSNVVEFELMPQIEKMYNILSISIEILENNK